jgi:tetraacyldisaccharide 4'-kinase
MLPTYRSKCKVISIGNVALGGTGKTPLVEWVASYFIKKQKRPGIIIRGYKRPRANERIVAKENSSYFEVGDEARMLRENLKNINIIVGSDKIKSARELEGKGCDVAVLDDGFQHWRLMRDLDIVTIDCSLSVSNHQLLPLGRLREPLSSLRRADIFMLTKVDLDEDNSEKLKEALKKINPDALIVSSVYEPVCFFDLRGGASVPLNSDKFLDKHVFILAGIANPIYFDKMLSRLKLKIKRELIYPDHYEFKRKDLDSINKLAKDMSVGTIITTHKDAVRLRHSINSLENNIDILYLKIQFKVTENEEKFCDRLLSVFNR